MVESAEALEVTSWTSEAMASTRSSWVCAERTVAEASASSGTACSVTSATSLVVALSVWASLTSTTARKETRIAQKTATRIPATSPPDTAAPLPETCRLHRSRRKVVPRAYRAARSRLRYRITGRRGPTSRGRLADTREPAAPPARKGGETAGSRLREVLRPP